MAEDPALPLTDVQFVLGHAQLTTTQIYLTPRKEDVIRRVLAHHAEQTRQAAAARRPGPGARATGPRRWTCCSGTGSIVTVAASTRRPLGRRRQAGACGASGARTLSRPGPARRPGPPPAGSQRSSAGRRLTARRSSWRTPAPRANASGRAGLLLDWLDDQPGATWQERWLASGADAAGAGWRQVAGTLAAATAADALRGCRPALAGALLAVICADLVRPSLGWLVGAAAGKGALARDHGQRP